MLEITAFLKMLEHVSGLHPFTVLGIDAFVSLGRLPFK